MGGSTGRGNTAPYAEYNAWVDPEAAAAVVASGIPFTMVGLNLTHQALATEAVLARLGALGTVLADTAVGWLTFFAGTYHEQFGFAAPPVHDPCAVALVAEPAVVRCVPAFVAIETQGRWTRGATVVDLDGRLGRAAERARGRRARRRAVLGPGGGRGRPAGDLRHARARRAAPGDRGARRVRGASGAVLVLEILGVRLLAPYVGLTLETYTTIIGVVLGGIAAGAALGGRAADTLRRPPAARAAADRGRAAGDGDGAARARVRRGALRQRRRRRARHRPVRAAARRPTVLSAVTPVVVKLQLGDLGATGAVVGRLSAWATAGALAGTFSTGFILVPLLPVRVTVVAHRRAARARRRGRGRRLPRVPRAPRSAPLRGSPCVLAAAGAAAGTRCTTESVYYCAQVVSRRRAGRSRARAACSTTCATPTSTWPIRGTSSSPTSAGSGT